MQLQEAAEFLAGLPASIVGLDAESAVDMIKVLDSEELVWTTLQVRSIRSF